MRIGPWTTLAAVILVLAATAEAGPRRPGGGGPGGPGGGKRPPVDDGPKGDAPVYFLVFAHHYNGKGGYYPTAAEVRTVVQAAADAGQASTFTAFFDGILLDRLDAQDPTLIPELRRLGVAIGYHGEDVHGPYPVVDASEDGGGDDKSLVTGGMSFAQGVEAIQTRYSHGVSGVQIDGQGWLARDQGKLDVGRRGGLSQVVATFGDVQYIGGTCLPTPPSAFAMRALSPSLRLWQGAGVFASHYLARSRNPALITTVEEYLGKDTQAFWYMGLPAVRQSHASSPPAWTEGGMRTRLHIEALSRREPTVVSLIVAADAGELADMYDYLGEYVASHPGSAFVNAATLRDRMVGPELSLDPTEVAREVVRTWAGGPPDALRVGGRPVALADALEVMAQAIVTQKRTPIGTTTINGPLEPAGAVVNTKGVLDRADVESAAKAVLAAVQASPWRAAPASVAAGKTRIGVHQAYRAFADYLASPGAKGVTLVTGEPWPPTARAINAAYPHTLAPDVDAWRGGAMWTARPVEWK